MAALVGVAVVATIEPSRAATVSLSTAIGRYAPLVYLHPDETLLPMAPKDFISQSELRWAHDDGCRDHAIDGAGVGAIDPSRLGAGTYPAHSTNHPSLFHPKPFCQHDKASYTTADHTRPFDALGAEGYFLDFQGDRNGSGLDVPVYYETVSQAGVRFVHYWFFFAYNNFHVNNAPNQAHEGDWERISVRLSSGNEATAVAFWNHGGYCTRTWAGVQKTKTNHPVVFSAVGSHASYPAPGNYEIEVNNLPNQTDRTRRSDKAWNTWLHRTNVKSASAGWYGYGGGWGSVDGPGPLGHKDFSGPLGPSKYKNASSTITSWNKPCADPS